MSTQVGRRDRHAGTYLDELHAALRLIDKLIDRLALKDAAHRLAKRAEGLLHGRLHEQAVIVKLVLDILDLGHARAAACLRALGIGRHKIARRGRRGRRRLIGRRGGGVQVDRDFEGPRWRNGCGEQLELIRVRERVHGALRVGMAQHKGLAGLVQKDRRHGALQIGERHILEREPARIVALLLRPRISTAAARSGASRQHVPTP